LVKEKEAQIKHQKDVEAMLLTMLEDKDDVVMAKDVIIGLQAEMLAAANTEVLRVTGMPSEASDNPNASVLLLVVERPSVFRVFDRPSVCPVLDCSVQVGLSAAVS
jgi:hypothetical protein